MKTPTNHPPRCKTYAEWIRFYRLIGGPVRVCRCEKSEYANFIRPPMGTCGWHKERK